MIFKVIVEGVSLEEAYTKLLYQFSEKKLIPNWVLDGADIPCKVFAERYTEDIEKQAFSYAKHCLKHLPDYSILSLDLGVYGYLYEELLYNEPKQMKPVPLYYIYVNGKKQGRAYKTLLKAKKRVTTYLRCNDVVEIKCEYKPQLVYGVQREYKLYKNEPKGNQIMPLHKYLFYGRIGV